MNQPNILLLMCDQFRGDCLSFAGHPDVKTPYLDTLAAEGAFFGHALSLIHIFTIRSVLHLYALKHSALPIEDPELVHLYLRCFQEIHFTKKVPLYRTHLLTSPAAAGVWRPCIYLPDTVIADSTIDELRFMLLHELQHTKQKDGIIICLTALASIFYWCNPAVHYALRAVSYTHLDVYKRQVLPHKWCQMPTKIFLNPTDQSIPQVHFSECPDQYFSNYVH